MLAPPVDDGAAALAQKLSRVVSAGSRVGAVFSLHASVASLNAEMAGGCGVRASPCPLHFSCWWWPQMAEVQGIRAVLGVVTMYVTLH